MRRDLDPSVQVGTMGSHSADRHFQRFLYGFCEGCSAAKRGPLRPRFAPLAVRWVVYLTAHFRAHSSIPAAVTGTPDRDDTAIAAVDAGAQHGRKCPLSPQVAMRFDKGFVYVCLKIQTHRSKPAW